MTQANPVYCALDTTNVARACEVAEAIAPYVGGLKIGMEFFNSTGPEGYRAVAKSGVPIFLDLKFHDIPNTVAGAIRATLPLKPAIVNVHASGGRDMMKAAIEEAETAGADRPKVIAVTVLTSLNATDLTEIGYKDSPSDQVRRAAELAHLSGLDGVVCSPHEIEVLRKDRGEGFMLVTPGIRPTGSAVGDQKRIMTPREALDKGSNVLVIGRPIFQAENPAQAAKAIAAEIGF